MSKTSQAVQTRQRYVSLNFHCTAIPPPQANQCKFNFYWKRHFSPRICHNWLQFLKYFLHIMNTQLARERKLSVVSCFHHWGGNILQFRNQKPLSLWVMCCQWTYQTLWAEALSPPLRFFFGFLPPPVCPPEGNKERRRDHTRLTHSLAVQNVV